MVPSFAQPVSVQEVRFSRVQAPGLEGDWLEAAVILQGGPSIEAREGTGARFNARVGVSLSIATRVGRPEDNQFAFYRSRLELVALEQARRVRVYFYLPPEVVRRDRLTGEPFAWLVQVAVGDQVLANEPSQYSGSLVEPMAARSFLDRVASEAPANDGILLPIYLTPFYQREAGRLRDLPSFVRPEVANPAKGAVP